MRPAARETGAPESIVVPTAAAATRTLDPSLAPRVPDATACGGAARVPCRLRLKRGRRPCEH